jgi:hypothetical protein
MVGQSSFKTRSQMRPSGGNQLVGCRAVGVGSSLELNLCVVLLQPACRCTRCHRWHSCPSDHATYRWRGLLCVAPYSDKRSASFKRRVRYEGRMYYCKR